MTALGNDRWRGSFTLHELGGYEYTVIAWADSWLSWKHDFERRVDAADIEVALAVAAELIGAGGRPGAGRRRKAPAGYRHRSSRSEAAPKRRHDTVLGAELQQLMLRVSGARSGDAVRHGAAGHRRSATRPLSAHGTNCFRARCAASGTHGRLADVEAILPQIAELGFDVLYLPPIHPIGITKRKGKNNALKAKPDDCGSPWAIGEHRGRPQVGSSGTGHT